MDIYREEDKDDTRRRRPPLLHLHALINFFTDRSKVGDPRFTYEEKFPALKLAFDQQAYYDHAHNPPAAFQLLCGQIDRILRDPEGLIPTLSLDGIQYLTRQLQSLRAAYASLDVLPPKELNQHLKDSGIVPTRSFRAIQQIQQPPNRKRPSRLLDQTLRFIHQKGMSELETETYPDDNDLPPGVGDLQGLKPPYEVAGRADRFRLVILKDLLFFKDLRYPRDEDAPEYQYPALRFILRARPDSPHRPDAFHCLFRDHIYPFMQPEPGAPPLSERDLKALYLRLRDLRNRFVAFHNEHARDPRFQKDLDQFAAIRANNERIQEEERRRVANPQGYHMAQQVDSMQFAEMEEEPPPPPVPAAQQLLHLQTLPPVPLFGAAAAQNGDFGPYSPPSLHNDYGDGAFRRAGIDWSRRAP